MDQNLTCEITDTNIALTYIIFTIENFTTKQKDSFGHEMYKIRSLENEFYTFHVQNDLFVD